MVIRFFEILRYLGFWIVDILKGGKVLAHYRDIKYILLNYYDHSSKAKRKVHLNNLLQHAVHTSPFYAIFKDYKDLQDFPIINKSIIRERREDFVSDTFQDKPIRTLSTSGSSGTPFISFQNKNKIYRNTADTIFMEGLAKYKIGHRIYYIRKWFDMHDRSDFNAWCCNIKKIEVTEFSDEYIKKFIDKLERDSSNKNIVGYSSALREICDYLDRSGHGPVKTNVNSIIAIAEAISDATRASLKKYFGAPVFLRYSNLENGILSLELDEEQSDLQINWASYKIELLHPEKDEVVAPGQVGRVVVTDLFNYCMPFIRYDTGDLAVMVDKSETFNGAPAFKRVEGRKMDVIYDTSGKVFSTFIVFHLESYKAIRQFQLIQTDDAAYKIKLNTEPVFDKEDEIIQLFKKYLGSDADIQVEYEYDIPQLSSGKRRLVINQWKLNENEQFVIPRGNV